MLKKLSLLAILAIILMVAILGFRQDQPVPVTVNKATSGSVTSTLKLTGRVINDHTVSITALHDGQIKKIVAREGSSVKSEGVLAVLDNRQALAQLKKAQAELSYQQKHYQSSLQNYNRIKKSRQQGVSSIQAMEDRQIELQNANARLAIAKAELDINQLRVDTNTVRAPFDGTITAQVAEVGQWVEAGTPLFTVVANEGKTIEVQVDASDFARVQLGQAAQISSDAWPDKLWSSQVSWIAPAVNNSGNDATNFFSIRIDIGEDAPALLLGQQLDVDLEFDRRDDVLQLPLHLMQEYEPGKFTILVVDGKVARQRNISVGLVSLLNAEITSGLNPDELVITSKGGQALNGNRVNVVSEISK